MLTSLSTYNQLYLRLIDTSFKNASMTTYIPSLTLPSVIFENAALSVLLPIAAGTAVGFSTQRKTITHFCGITISILTSP